MIRPLPQAWIDGLLEAVWLVDEKTLYILAANQAAEHLTGLSIADMLGTPVTLLAATPQDQIFWSQPAAVVADGIHSHTSVLHATGILVAVERRVTRVPRLEGGTAFLVTMVDRSHQQATERELETLLAELRATLDSAADGMLVCGLDGRVRAFNQRLAQLWNVPAPLLVRRDDEALFAHMADQVADVPTYVERLAAVVAEPMQESIDILGLRNGMSLERRSVPQFSQGRAVGRVYSFRDITRQHEVQASLRLAARVFVPRCADPRRRPGNAVVQRGRSRDCQDGQRPALQPHC